MPKVQKGTKSSALQRERQRLAQLLHDTTCQELTGICLMARAAARQCRAHRPETEQKLEEIAELIQRAGANLAEIMRGLVEPPQ